MVSYEPTWAVLNAADYGVPQLRYRFFLVAHRVLAFQNLLTAPKELSQTSTQRLGMP
jgi:site-specific DNA-cytosine methylase